MRGAFGATADPVIQFGLDVERLLLIIAGLLGIIVVAVAVVPWLTRYLPWRVERTRRGASAKQVVDALLADPLPMAEAPDQG